MEEPNASVRRVVLDTNALIQHSRPSNALRLIGREVNHGRLALVVPELVVMEATNRYREKVSTALKEARKTLDTLSVMKAIDEIPYLPIDPEQAVGEFDADLRSTLAGLGAVIEDIPEPSHREVVERALQRKQPFTREDSGYRDTLIWETVRLLAARGQAVTLVSHDRRAFHAGPDVDGLSPRPASELLAESGSVEVVSDLQDVVNTYVDREMALMREVQGLLDSEALRNQILNRLTSQLVGESLDKESLRGFNVDEFDFAANLEPSEELTSVEVMGVDVQNIHALRDFTLIDARSLDSKEETAIEFEAEVKALVDVWIGAGVRIRETLARSGEIDIRQAGFVSTHPEERTLSIFGEATLNRVDKELTWTNAASIRLQRRRSRD